MILTPDIFELLGDPEENYSDYEVISLIRANRVDELTIDHVHYTINKLTERIFQDIKKPKKTFFS